MSEESWDESWFFDIANLEDFDDEVDKSDFEEILEEFPNAANLADVIAVRQHQPIITGANCLSNDSNFIQYLYNIDSSCFFLLCPRDKVPSGLIKIPVTCLRPPFPKQ